jgi:hypothetical protein
MNQEHQTLAERRLLLLEEIAELADEISRIDDRQERGLPGGGDTLL